MEIKNKEFETAQVKFKEMVEQNQKEKLETIQAKERAFEANIKSLTEQIKAKEENIKIIQANNEVSLKQQIELTNAENFSKVEILAKDKENLTKQLDLMSKKYGRVTFYIIISIVIGLIIGLILK